MVSLILLLYHIILTQISPFVKDLPPFLRGLIRKFHILTVCGRKNLQIFFAASFLAFLEKI